MAVEVREARPEDLDEAAAVMVEAYQEYRQHVPPALWEDYARDIRNVQGRLGRSRLLVAVEEGRILGAVTYYPRDDTGSAGIRLLAVHPTARGKGYGRLLMQHCLYRARAEGAQAIGLHTTPMMAVAQAMYERMGFLREPEQDMQVTPELTVMAYRLELGVS